MDNAMEREQPRRARTLADLNPLVPAVILAALVAVVSYQADKLVYVLGIPPDHIASFWPATAFLVGVLLLAPRKIWTLLIAAGLGGMALADLNNGVPIRFEIWITLGNLAETLVAALGLSLLFEGAPDLSNLKALAKYMLFAVILVPFVSALLGAIGSAPGGYMLQWRLWFFADALAFLTVAPAILTWVRGGREWSRKPQKYLEFAAQMTSLVLFGYLTFMGTGRGEQPALLYSLVPLLLWAALRFGLKGVSTSMIAVAFLSIWGASNGRGPFAGQGPLNNALSLQLFLFFAAIPFTILAVVVEEQKRAREVLRDSEERFRMAAQAGKMFAYEWDVSTDKIVRTEGVAQILGVNEGAVTTGQHILAMVPPQDRERLIAAVAKLSPEEPSLQISYRIVRSNGAVVWVERNSRAYFDEQGRIMRMIGMVADITARKLAEDELARANDRLRLAMDAAKSVGWDREVKSGRDTLFGDLESVFGIPSEVHDGCVEDFHRSLHPDDRGWVLEAIKNAMESKKPYTAEFRILRQDGTVRWLAARGKFYYSPEGEPERMLGMSVDITDRKLAERDLRDSEERLRLAAQAGKMYAFDWDVATDVIMRSEESARIFGSIGMPAGTTKQQLLARVHPEDHAAFITSNTERTPESPDNQLTYRLLRPDGSVLWIERTGHAIFDQRGKMVRMIGMVADISERKRAEEGLRQKEIELSEAQRLAQIGSWEWDPSTDTVTWSRELYRIAGRDPNLPAASYKEHSLLLTAESWERLQRSVEETLRSGTPYELDLEYVRPDGSTIWARGRGEAQRDTAGRIVRLRGTSQDITQRKLAERELRESEERLRLAAQVGKMYAFDWDAATDVVIRSTESTNILGVTEDQVGLTLKQILANVHPEDRATFMSSIDNLTPENPNTRISFRLCRPDGSVAWLERSGHAFFDKQGRIQRMVGMVADITDRKLAEEALSKVGGRLIEAHEEERSRIARDLHDDIGQRLALLVNDIDGLKSDLPDSAVQVRNRIQEQLKRVHEVAVDVQAISHRLHSSKLRYLGIVSAAKSFCQELSEQQKVEIDFIHSDIPRRVPEEISLCLFRIMQEALQNAVKHSGVRHFEVELRGALDGIHLTVHDAGLGFDPEGVMNNRGLGLISMQERVNLVNGTLSIDSRPELGTTIRVRVPLMRESISMSASG
jgi:PAS domain S-box-containing protein